MDTYIFFYVGGLIISLILTLIYLGYESGHTEGLSMIALGMQGACMSVLWPIVAVAYILQGIVAFPFKLGQKLREWGY